MIDLVSPNTGVRVRVADERVENLFNLGYELFSDTPTKDSKITKSSGKKKAAKSSDTTTEE